MHPSPEEELPIPEVLVKRAFGRMENFQYSRTEEGNPRYELQAKVAEYYQQENKAEFYYVTAFFFDKKGHKTTLIGDKGRLDTVSKDVWIYGNVEADTDDGTSLVTNSLMYSDENKILWTDDPVIIFAEKMTLTGVGMQYELDMKKFHLWDQVEGTSWH